MGTWLQPSHLTVPQQQQPISSTGEPPSRQRQVWVRLVAPCWQYFTPSQAYHYKLPSITKTCFLPKLRLLVTCTSHGSDSGSANSTISPRPFQSPGRNAQLSANGTTRALPIPQTLQHRTWVKQTYTHIQTHIHINIKITPRKHHKREEEIIFLTKVQKIP